MFNLYNTDLSYVQSFPTEAEAITQAPTQGNFKVSNTKRNKVVALIQNGDVYSLVDRWVKVEDELPTPREVVLVSVYAIQFRQVGMGLAYSFDGRWWDPETDSPLPDDYKVVGWQDQPNILPMRIE